MANLREVSGLSCVSPNLGMSEWSERAIDRVAAMGMAARDSMLGVEVFRWAYAGDIRAGMRLCRLLIVRLLVKHPEAGGSAEGVARQAMREFSDWACPVCGGRKEEVLANGVRITCDIDGGCGGTGLRKYSNGERSRGSGVGRWTPQSNDWLDFCLDLVRRGDSIANVSINLQLERTLPRHKQTACG